MILALLLSSCIIGLLFLLIVAVVDIDPEDYLLGAGMSIFITFFVCAIYFSNSKGSLEFVLDSTNKELILENGQKLKIYYYNVSKSDSTKIKIRAGKEKAPDKEKENEFTNFN